MLLTQKHKLLLRSIKPGKIIRPRDERKFVWWWLQLMGVLESTTFGNCKGYFLTIKGEQVYQQTIKLEDC